MEDPTSLVCKMGHQSSIFSSISKSIYLSSYIIYSYSYIFYVSICLLLYQSVFLYLLSILILYYDKAVTGPNLCKPIQKETLHESISIIYEDLYRANQHFLLFLTPPPFIKQSRQLVFFSHEY